jgi:regulator of sirC expression with transglutaminase-like and TPR domain
MEPCGRAPAIGYTPAVQPEPRSRFAALASRPDDEIDLGEGALLIAAETYPGLDVDGYLARLDALAQGARAAVEGACSGAERVERLNRFLFVEEGFEGNVDDYGDPRNSFLNEVLDRRTGIPITLSVVYIEVARRLGLPVRGVGFPGHFLAKYEGEEQIVIDPFFGKVLSEADCAERLREFVRDEIEFDPSLLESASPREILARMLRNLKRRHVEEGDFESALSCCERILLLTPGAMRELRDRGLLYQQLECFRAALSDLERYVELAPDDPATRTIRMNLVSLRRRVAAIH